jgi:sugar lactone lactonase YvrE
MRTLRCAIAIIAFSGACVAAGAPPPVSLVAQPPTLVAGRVWTATLRITGNAAPALSASNGSRSVRFRVRRLRPHRFSAAVVIPAAGRWQLVAHLGRRSFRLATLRVVTPSYRLAEPGQVLATPDGSLLVAERGLRGQITLVHPQDGEVGVFARGLPRPYGLAFAPDRTVLVSAADGIYRVPPHGGTPRRVVATSVGPMLPQDARTIVYGRPDEVGRLDLETGETRAFGSQVTAPHSLALAEDGRLLVTDTAGRILAVDLPSGVSTTVADGLQTPLGMVLEPGGSILVLEFEPGRLVRIGPGGSRTTVAAGFRRPYSLTIGRDGNAYVAEVGDLGSINGTLKRVTPEGLVSTVRLHD